MSRWLRPAVVVAVLALAALACEGGSVLNQSLSCGPGQCEGSVDRLTGSYTIEIIDPRIFPSDAVQVTIELTSSTGRVEATLTGPDGTTASGVASPGAPAVVSGLATGEWISVDSASGFDEDEAGFSGQEGGFKFVLTALDESAEDITYRVSYSLP